MKTKVRCQIWVPLCASCHSLSLAAAGQGGNRASEWLLLIYLFFDKVSCSLHWFTIMYQGWLWSPNGFASLPVKCWMTNWYHHSTQLGGCLSKTHLSDGWHDECLHSQAREAVTEDVTKSIQHRHDLWIISVWVTSKSLFWNKNKFKNKYLPSCYNLNYAKISVYSN